VSEIFRNQSVYKTKLLDSSVKFWFGFVRPRERSSGNWGIGGTLNAELELRNGRLKPDGILSDGFRGFRFPASPQLTGSDLSVRVVEYALNE
jgi:hypothetical protein